MVVRIQFASPASWQMGLCPAIDAGVLYEREDVQERQRQQESVAKTLVSVPNTGFRCGAGREAGGLSIGAKAELLVHVGCFMALNESST